MKELCDIIKNWRNKCGGLRFGQWLYAILGDPIIKEYIDNEYLIKIIEEETNIALLNNSEINFRGKFLNHVFYNKDEIIELIGIIKSFKEKSLIQWIFDISKPESLFYIEDDELIEKIQNSNEFYIVLYNDTKILLGLEEMPIEECKTTEDYYENREVIQKFNSEEEAIEGVRNFIIQEALSCSFGEDIREQFKNIKILKIKEVYKVDINGPIFDEANAIRSKKDEDIKKYKIEQLEKELEKWKDK